jgi:hypothetical protein
MLQQFRKAVYQSIQKRADAFFNALDALTVAGHVNSPVALSEETPFQRKFSSIFDMLQNAELDFDQLLPALYDHQPADSELIEGYELYSLDTTPNERSEAETLEDRGSLKAQKEDPVRYGHKYSWLTRLVTWGTSWVAPVDVQRVATCTTDSQAGAVQVEELDQRHNKPKVIVADSLYGNHLFLRVFRKLRNTLALVRMRSNTAFWGPPKPRQKGDRGAPAKHGAKFKLSDPSRPADQQDTLQLKGQTVTLQAWENLHLKKLPDLVGMVLRVEFLRSDGTPRYKRPIWLFWTGATTTPLKALCVMYLWRFAIEHYFRFLKQHMGLNANQSTDTVSTDHWMWLCGLAYWQLLLMRDEVENARPAWYPAKADTEKAKSTPGMVQRSALRFLEGLGTPASAPRNAGKGTGRAKGHHPPARKRYAIVKKAKIVPNRASASP